MVFGYWGVGSCAHHWPSARPVNRKIVPPRLLSFCNFNRSAAFFSPLLCGHAPVRRPTSVAVQGSPIATLNSIIYSGQIHIGLIAADSVAQASVGFRQVPIVEDPYVFAVQNSIDLGITDINSAPADVARVLNSCIVFSFGTLHGLGVRKWYQRALPSSRIVVHCRS